MIDNENEIYETIAEIDFQFVGTMNPGGDYGKKELSPALRNRFTEIWADTACDKFDSYLQIMLHNLKISSDLREVVCKLMTEFLIWFQKSEIGKKVTLNTRDVITWINFMNQSNLKWFESLIHGVHLIFLDGLGSGSRIVYEYNFVKSFQEESINYLMDKISKILSKDVTHIFSAINDGKKFVVAKNKVGIHPFYISKGKFLKFIKCKKKK